MALVRPAGAAALGFLALAGAGLGCRGSAPPRDVEPSAGVSAVLVRARLIVPTGETASGSIALNLESDVERYRLPFPPKQTALYVIEPGTYRLHPTRGFSGGPEDALTIVINRKVYKAPFPRDILRREPLRVKATKIIPIGILEAKVIFVPGAPAPRLEVRLDDSVAARRALVQDMVAQMLDEGADPDFRERAIQWTRALDQAMVSLAGMEDAPAAFKPYDAP